MSNTLPKLHNAMWPGLVGKGDGEGQEPPISLERMLDLTAAANVNGQKFEGIDYFLFLPHTNPEASDDELKKIADLIASKGFSVGSLVAPVWPGTVGDSAAIQAGIKKEDWNEYKIIAKGNHVQHFINGMQTIDVTDEDAANAPKEGLLALQIHQGPPMVVQFKNFKLVELK